MSKNIDPIDAALAAQAKKKRSPKKSIAPNSPVNISEPAHSIINKLGGVRALSRSLGLSAAAVTRWQTKKTKAKQHGGNGVIPEKRRAALISLAKELRVRLSKSDF